MSPFKSSRLLSKKRFLHVTFSLVTMTFSVRATASVYSDAVLALNPQAYWQLNDASGNGVDLVGAYPGNDPIVNVESGVSRGIPGPSSAAYPGLGPNNLAWGFQTGAGAQTLNYIPATGNSARTIVGWMELGATPDAQGGEVSFASYGMGQSSSNTGTAFNLDVQDGFNHSTGQALGYDVFALNIGGREVQATTTPISTGTWYMYAAVVPNGATSLGQVQLYVDGVQQSLINDTLVPINTAPASQTATPFRLGRDYGGYGFDGDLSNVSVWNSALTSSQIQGLYQVAVTNTLPGNLPPLTPITPAGVPWSVTPMKGQSQFVFASGSPPSTGNYTAFVASLNNLMSTQMGNGIDPFFGPESYNIPLYQYVAQTGLYVDAWHDTTSNGVYVPGNPGFNATQDSVIAITDKPGAPTSVQFAEWDYTFAHLLGNSNNGYGNSPPTTKKQAYNDLEAYYTGRNAAYDGRFLAEAGLSNYEPYEAQWGTQAIGMELGENILSSQLKMAMARGASRQYGIPWMVDVSPWFQGTETTAGPLTGGAGNARGIDAGHSESLFQRLWYHSWFAGAAMVTPEGGGNYLYNEGGAAPYTETSLGVIANNFYKFTLNHDRGVAYTPVAIVLDNLAGYNAYEGKPWGILTPDTGDTEIDDLFKYQIYPGSGASTDPSHTSNPEAPYLVSTPYGEMFDVLLSNAPGSTLSQYSDIVLAGDINFTSSFMSQLQAALKNGSKLMLSQAQASALGASGLSLLQGSGNVEVMAPSTVPQTGRPAAISNQELAQLNSTLMPLAITGAQVQYEINKNAEGWVLELINDNGLTKIPWLPATSDPTQVANVTIQSRLAGNWAAYDWQTNQLIPMSSTYWSVSVAPGGLKYMQFLPELTWNNASAGAPADGLTWNTTNNNWNNGVVATPYTDGAIVSFNDTNNGNYSVNLNGTVKPTSVTFSSVGNYSISGSGTIVTGTIAKSGSGTLTLGTSVNANSLAITGGTVKLATDATAGTLASAPASSNITFGSLAITGGGTLDIGNNHILVTYGSGSDPIASIAAWIANGYANGLWNGTGIISSAAAVNAQNYGFGYADSADLGNPAGLASGTIEIKYTLVGDCNLDGVVNGADFAILAANFNKGSMSWDQGDFDHNGMVNGIDFSYLAANFNKAAAGASTVGALEEFAASNGLLADVPEPGSAALAGIAIIQLARRGRLRRKLELPGSDRITASPREVSNG
jgi:hypothetical protein